MYLSMTTAGNELSHLGLHSCFHKDEASNTRNVSPIDITVPLISKNGTHGPVTEMQEWVPVYTAVLGLYYLL